MAVIKPKVYQTFRGVDYSASPSVISEVHASDMLNMYIGSDGVLQKRPGWHILKTFQVSPTDATRLPINGLHFMQFAKGNGYMFIHAGTRLYAAMFAPGLRHILDRGNDRNDPGDVPYFKYDGDIPTAADAALINRYLAGYNDGLADWQIKNMDVDGDGRVTADDAQMLLSMIVDLAPYASNLVLSSSYELVLDSNSAQLQMAPQKSVSFEHDGNLYILDGVHYYRIKPKYSTGGTVAIGFTGETVEGFTPTTGLNGHYEYDELNEEGTNTPGSAENPGVWVGAEKYQSRNLLETKQINTFTADGIHKDFYLTENSATINKVEILTWQKCKNVDGEDTPTDDNTNTYYAYAWQATTDYTATQASSTEPSDGVPTGVKITFTNIPALHSEGKVNIRVTFTPTKYSASESEDRALIEKCSIVTKFGYFNDNRFWFAGNPEHKNTDYMSEVDDPTYFPADGWTNVGSDLTAIQGYLHYGSELAIIKEDNNQDATVYMRSAILTDGNEILFPVQQGAQGVGAISKWCLKTLKDEPMFLAKEGVYAIQGTDASQERTIPNRSFFVDKKLQPEATPGCVAEVFKDYYIVCNGASGHCWVADSRYQALPPGTNDRNRVYEWFPWDNVPARCMLATDDYLFFGTNDGRLCVFNTDWEHPKRWTDGAEFVDGSTVWHKWHPYDDGYEIHAHYVTKRDHLSSLDFKKTMLNDGGVIILKPHEQSSASITVTTDKGSWFVEQIFTDSDEPSVVIPIRKRFKNFDSIETRIENNEIREGLSILGLQYRYVITTNRR